MFVFDQLIQLMCSNPMPTAPRMGPRDTFRAQIGRNLSIDKLTLNVADATICQSVKVSNTDIHLQLGHGFTRYTGTQSLANAKAAPQSRLLLPLSLHFLILSFLLSTSSNWFWHQQRHQHCHCNAARGSYHILS